jgi:hypothetical protein
VPRFVAKSVHQAPFTEPLATCHLQRSTRTRDHDTGTIAEQVAADTDHPPAECSKLGSPIDVGGSLRRVGPVLRPIELHAEAVAYHNLRLWFWQPGIDEREPRPRFLRRFGAAVHQLQHAPQLDDPPQSAMIFGDGFDGGRPNSSSVCQGV